jgi:DNA mismatch endonuclease, patch repair protein
MYQGTKTAQTLERQRNVMPRPTQFRSRPSRQLTSFGHLNRSELMSRVRSKGNKTTEQRMVQLLRFHRLSGWRRHADLPGRPDFVWPRARVALFVHGCFWHGHDCGRNLKPKRNIGFWENKIVTNRRRDRRNRLVLRQQGWSVITVWECHLSRSPAQCLVRIKNALETHSSRVALTISTPRGGFRPSESRRTRSRESSGS